MSGAEPEGALPELAATWTAGLRGSLGRPLHCYLELTSSLDLLGTLAESGAPTGTCVATELQRSGRGRRGATWLSPPGDSLLIALLLRPAIAPEDGGLISLAAALALVRAAAELGVTLQVKWPNDVLWGGRKVAGILPESRLGARGFRHVLLGMGVNVHQREFPPDLQESASSLDLAAGRRIPRAELYVALLSELEAILDSLEGGDRSPLIDGWLAAWAHRGWRARDGSGRELELLGLSDRGELRVRPAIGPGGREETIGAGELTLIGAP